MTLKRCLKDKKSCTANITYACNWINFVVYKTLTEIMFRLLVLTALLTSTNAGLVRIPKIYNALISSDENLSPSHTYPIVEPVLRTTALGVAFPPLLASPPIHKEPAQSQTDENSAKKEEITAKAETATESDKKDEAKIKDDAEKLPELSYHGTLYPLAFDPYLSYAYSNDFLFPALPYYEHPVFVDLHHFKDVDKVHKEKEEINPAVNFKKNPDIPDVPPPPLPINKEESKEKQ
ncbi:hypothetical protein Trydic_g10746 [Trypoxylus dichotomus]